MTEAELYQGLTDALTIAGWRWFHIIRSDGVMTGTGAEGWPDLFAVHPERGQVIVWELKSSSGRPTLEQWAWIGPLAVAAVTIGSPKFDARVIYPADYDAALEYIVGRSDRMVVAWRDRD